MTDMMVAEGIPLTAGSAALPTLGESALGGMDTSAAAAAAQQQELTPQEQISAAAAAARKAKREAKRKKREEEKATTTMETFDDEYQDNDDASYQDEGDDDSLSPEEKAEKREKEVKKTLCWAVLNALGMVFLMGLVSKLLQRMSSSGGEDMGVQDELVQVAGQALPAPPPGTSGAIHAGIAQNMAVAAGQGAAASTAAGTTGAAATAAAAATVATTTVVTGSTVGITAVSMTGLAMVTGVLPNPLTSDAGLPCHEFIHDMKVRSGEVVLHVEGLKKNFFNDPNTKELLEEAFTKSYNDILGTCVEHMVEGHNDTLLEGANSTLPTDVYARYMEGAQLEGWDFWEGADENGDRVNFFKTEWIAMVGCDDHDGDSLGCSPIEPLFYEGDFDQRDNYEGDYDALVGRRRRRDLMFSSEHHNRWLQIVDPDNGKSNMELFVERFQEELRDLLETQNPNDDDEQVTIFFGETLATNNTVYTHNVVETYGEQHSGATMTAASGVGGTIDRPMLDTCLKDNGKPYPGLEEMQGSVTLGFIDLDATFFADQQEIIQESFRSAYNDVMEGCDGEFRRVMQKAESTGSTPRSEQGQQVLTSSWTALIVCDGCHAYEPLFASDKQSPTANDKTKKNGRRLIEEETKMALFANEFAKRITVEHQKLNPDAPATQAYYAAVHDQLDNLGAIVGSAGTETPFASTHDDLVDCATGKAPTDETDFQEAKFELYIQNLVKDINQTILAAVIQDVYNDISGMCEGQFQRVAHAVAIEDLVHKIVDNKDSFVGFNATVQLTCNGCQGEEEPMFIDYTETTEETRRMLQESDALFEQFRGMMTNQLNVLIRNFRASEYYAEGVSLFETSDPSADYKDVDVVFGVTYGRSGQVAQSIGHSPAASIPSNIFDDEELMEGEDAFVSKTDCQKALMDSYADTDAGLSSDEYFAFVQELFAVIDEGNWPQALGSYADLPAELQVVFDKFSEDGAIPLNEPENGQRYAGAEFDFAKGLCYHASFAVRAAIKGETLAPTVPDATDRPTEAPVTDAPITSPPTLAPSTGAPSESPTIAPTETRIVKISAEWKFTMTPNERDATEEEKEGFIAKATEWISAESDRYYTAEETAFKFISQELSLKSSDWDEASGFVIITESDFTFEGDPQPATNAVADVMSAFDLQSFIEGELWDQDAAEDSEVWIWDLITGAALVASNVQ